ncbi:hypothetical protein CMUS01_04438 [Colletotrichum musicola]|uniref:Uncharacterized protein n=1 Tax=Colletotrichum musicola TaxID=2175873 RepID=A0A8H6KWI3_9PEZI|nr:hypothetical protein CMUS01_04438 [Colletotrichum musicola]
MTSWRLSGALACFTLFVPTIIAEDAFQWTWSKLKTKAGFGADDLRLLEKAFGFVWTFLALAVVTPVFNYPLQRVPTKSNPQYVVPWSFFGPNYGGKLSK